MNLFAQIPDPGQLALLIPIVGIMIPIVAILTNHQRKMAEIMHGGQQNQLSAGQLDAIHRELRDLREQLHTQAIQLDDMRGLTARTTPPSPPTLEQ